MLSVLQAVFTMAFFVLWLGGSIFLAVRVRIAQNSYLRQIPELDGVPLDGAPLGMPRGSWTTIWDAMWDWQFDPDLEAKRHAMWVRYRWMVAWIFGFPLIVVATMVLLIVSGHGAIVGWPTATSATTRASASPTGALLGYDNARRLASWQNTPSSPTQSASYLYDGEGQRVQQVATASGASTTTSYIGALEEVTSSGGTTTTTAYYGSLAESVNGTLSYLLSDGLGSVSEAVSTAGAVSATQLYAPYGGVRYQSGTLPTSKGYTGQRSNAATSPDRDVAA